MIMTREDEEDFRKARKCHICEREYVTSDHYVRDHCHITGKYRGRSHRSCNLNYKYTDKVPVIFHNLREYDSHFIMQEIGKFKKKINLIPNNMEKYLAFMIGDLVFIDSYQYMDFSLEDLVSWQRTEGME